MESVVVKKTTYEVVEQLNEYTYVIKDNDKEYLLYDFNDSVLNFKNFRFAYKRLKNVGVSVPKLIAYDKKSRRFVLERLVGDTVFDLLREKELDEKIYEQAFLLNYKARINRMRLDFSPENFVLSNGTLYYTAFTFTEYIREEDFSQKELRQWFYTKDFTELLISKGLPIDKSRIKNEFAQNKEMVLLVVKYFR